MRKDESLSQVVYQRMVQLGLMNHVDDNVGNNFPEKQLIDNDMKTDRPILSNAHFCLSYENINYCKIVNSIIKTAYMI